MAKYAFNHDSNDFGTALGIDSEQIELIQEHTKDMAVRAVLTDRKINTDSKAFEILLNKLQPDNIVEALLIGRLYGGYVEKMKQVGDSLAETIK